MQRSTSVVQMDFVRIAASCCRDGDRPYLFVLTSTTTVGPTSQSRIPLRIQLMTIPARLFT